MRTDPGLYLRFNPLNFMFKGIIQISIQGRNADPVRKVKYVQYD